MVLAQIVSGAGAIDTLQKTWAELGVYIDGGGDDYSRGLIKLLSANTPRALRPLRWEI